jgi:hypothetical protein
MNKHNLPLLQGIKKKYILTEEEFYAIFGDYPVKAFIVTETEGGRIYHHLSTGESFTVMDDSAEVKTRITEYLERKKTLRTYNRSKRG